MVKVGHVCTSRMMYKLLEDKLILLSKKGYEINIISARDYKEINTFNENGICQKYVDMDRRINLTKDIKSIINMYKLFKEEKYTIVHTHNAKAGLIGRIAAKMAKIPVVIHTSHGLPFFEGQSKLKYNAYKLIEILGLRFCDYFGSQNEEDLNIMRRYAKENRIFYEGNGIDKVKLMEIYNSITEKDLLELREELGISVKDKIFFMGARFEAVKNHKLLFEALMKLKEAGISNFTCLLAGQGEMEDSLKTEVKKLGIDKNIIFLGYRRDIYKYIKLSDIVLLTSFKEGIPRILMESMYFKKVIIATDVLGTRELVVNDVSGLLSSPEDSENLYENIKLVLEDNDLAEKFMENAHNRVLNNFTEQLVVSRLDDLYAGLIKQKCIIN